jgi:hypothetical protein
MSDVYEDINILRAVAHESRLETVPPGHVLLSHEIVGNVSLEQIRKLMIEEGVQCEGVNGFEFYDVFMERVMRLVMSGYRVQGPWLHASIGLSGTVPVERLGHNAQPGEVRVKVNFNLGKHSREMIDHMQVGIHPTLASGAPVIQSIINPTSADEPQTMDQGGMVVIKGLNVAVEGDKPEEIGVFLSDASAPAGSAPEIHIPAGKCSPNTASHVQFVLPPAITAGLWTVRLATQMTSAKGRFTKEARSFTYASPVTVL